MQNSGKMFSKLGEKFKPCQNKSILSLQYCKHETITAEIIKDLTTLKDTSEVTSKQVLILTQRVEAQKIQKTLLDSSRVAKEFDS